MEVTKLTKAALLAEHKTKSKGYQLYTNGCVFKEEIEFDEWEKLGNMLFTMSGAMLWYVGDWVNFGEKKFGEKYSQALEITKYDYGTLRNAAYVAARYPIVERHPNLSWRHHADCARFETADRKQILDMAESQGMSSVQLREFLHKQFPSAYKQVTNASVTTFDGWYAGYKKVIPPELLQHPDLEHLMKDAWLAGQKSLDGASNG